MVAKLSLLIPFLPLFGWLLLFLFGDKIGKRASGFLATGLIGISFLVTCAVALSIRSTGSLTAPLYNWLSIGPVTFTFSLLFDQLSILLAMIVTGVGCLIHLYSVGYMKHDEGIARFFSYLNLFCFFMLVLVLSDSFLGLFIGWEGVGLCSYLLIGFWYRNPEYHHAAKKAFLMNRIGDIGFIMALFYMLSVFGSSAYSVVFAHAGMLGHDSLIVTVITLLLFIGVIGKSAQIPLYTWLPDAMAGPTPVSALIHAATMVIAGIYLIARSHVLFAMAPITMTIIVVIGAATALLAAVIAIGQTDIKKVLAYSTVSQLGFMVVSLGMGGWVIALFHMATHAFFKALLFLSSGNVIHALDGEQNVYKMGGLRKALPFTSTVFLIGVLAIAGLPPLSGFFSKDAILELSAQYSWLLFGFLALVAVLTAFYMLRLYFLVFEGDSRSSAHHPHEGTWEMQVPLAVLAGLAVVGGALNLPFTSRFGHRLTEYLSHGLGIGAEHVESESHVLALSMLGATLIVLPIVMVLAKKYGDMQVARASDANPTPLIPQLVFRLFYVDDMYTWLFVRPYAAVARGCDRFVEPKIIDGAIRGISSGGDKLGGLLQKVQTGNVGTYVLGMVIGLCALIWMILL